MTVKKWLLSTGILVGVSLGSVATVNYIVDPLWMYSYDNRFNSMQYSMDDRQLKTNKFYFRPEPEIDTLMIGSSRTSYISEKVFKNHNVFNFAEDNMCVFEMKDTIEAAKKIHGKDFDTIIIGFDFFGSSKGKWVQEQKKERPSQFAYLEKASDPMYRLKSTLSFSTLKYSLINIKTAVKKTKNIIYDRDNIKSYLPYTKDKNNHMREVVFKNFKEKRYGTFVYDMNMTEMYRSMIKSNPNTKFIVFTTPVEYSVYNLQNELISKDDYKRWLKDLVEVFGEVYDFTGMNSVNIDPENYRDPQHFDPKIGTLVAKRIMGINSDSIPENFGILLNRKNIKEYIENIDTRDMKTYEKYILTE